MPVTVVTKTPGTIVTSGVGIPWQLPPQATSTGAGTNQIAVISSYSITSNVATFITTNNILVSGQTVTLTGFINGTYFNNQVVTVLATGLSSTQFEANFTHADVGSTNDSGIATPTTNYAFIQDNQPLSLPAGTYAVQSYPQTFTDATTGGGAFFGNPFRIYASVRGNSGFNGTSIGNPNTATGTATNFPIPNLPVGATVTHIYAVYNATQTSAGPGSPFQRCVATWRSGGNFTFTLNGTNSTVDLGTDLSVIPTVTFSSTCQATLSSGSLYTYYSTVTQACIVVEYTTTGTPVSPDQLQTLAAGNCGFSIANNYTVVGVAANFSSGLPVGTATLSAQLTINGTPVGNAKTFSPTTWASPFTLGGSSDTWGASLNGLQINGSNGLGINVTGTLTNGQQVNLNNLSLTVYAVPSGTVFWISKGTTKNLL